jgi:hypothetical protein
MMRRARLGEPKLTEVLASIARRDSLGKTIVKASRAERPTITGYTKTEPVSS